MKKIFPYILCVLLTAGLVFMYFDKDSGHDQELKTLIEKHQSAMDSSAKVAEHWRLKALEYGNQFRKEATKALQSEQRLSYAMEENRILKRKVIRYDHKQLDSLFTARYP